MGNYSNLKANIASVIKQNGNNEITGESLQQVLLYMVSNLGANYSFGGLISPGIVRFDTDHNVFFVASRPGTYTFPGTNFSHTILDWRDVTVFTWNGQNWTHGPLGIRQIIENTFAVETTWASLKNKRDNGTLIPGVKYLITDYETKTTEVDTTSAGHRFGIIVTATTPKTLSETANACHLDSDTYFQENGAKPETWKIRYCLDNDSSRFAWSDDSGKGVIYYMKDEWGNECPYDFKNIKFKHPNSPETYTGEYYTFSWVDENQQIHDLTLKQSLQDSDGNSPGTHSNVIKPYLVTGSLVPGNENDKQVVVLNHNLFICSYSDEGGLFRGCESNYLGYESRLNTFNKGGSANTIGEDSYSNEFKGRSYSNKLGNECYENVFYGSSRCNVLEDSCSGNIFSDGSNYNTLHQACRSNTLYSTTNNNTLYQSCQGVILDEECKYNTIGAKCSDVVLNPSCLHNNIGSNCSGITLGDESTNNTIGNSSANITSAGKLRYCTFGPECKNITLSNPVYQMSFGNSCQSIELVGGSFRYSTIGNGVRYIKVEKSGDGWVQNVNIEQGVSGTSSTTRTFTIQTGRNYQTTIGRRSDGTIVTFCLADLV